MTLRDAAAKRGLLIGTCISAAALTEPDYVEVAGREFNQAEPENEMKFGVIHPRRDTNPNPYDFSGADAIVEFALQHNMKARGHCFVWHSQVGDWVTSTSHTPDELSKVLDSHIQTVASRYAGKVYAWDVVNEAFEEDGSLRHTVWYDEPGIGLAENGTAYIEQSFRWARQYDPSTALYYNDYSCDTINPKSDAVYEMVKDFKTRNVPIDGVGFQMHLHLDSNNPATLESIKQNLQRFADLDIDVQITEMDVALESPDEDSLAQQAEIYRAIFEICLGIPRVTAIQTWGFTDKHSWIPGFTKGQKGWALLLDEHYAVKPAYTRILETLQAS